ncbi:MAG: DUF3341 domain-containing protein [Chloroflexi bacterium]|nr:DUF3341 domain-containing protein [Chloroflexota bacterium]
MAKRSVLGLFKDADSAANGVDALKGLGISPMDYDILTGMPYPDGAFGEPHTQHKLFVFPLVGAICGLAVAILVTAGTQLSYPMVTGGKPILSVPAMAIISYEATLLGAILFTVLGIIFESRLPRMQLGLYDPRITEGYIGLAVSCDERLLGTTEEALKGAGAEEVKHN